MRRRGTVMGLGQLRGWREEDQKVCSGLSVRIKVLPYFISFHLLLPLQFSYMLTVVAGGFSVLKLGTLRSSQLWWSLHCVLRTYTYFTTQYALLNTFSTGLRSTVRCIAASRSYARPGKSPPLRANQAGNDLWRILPEGFRAGVEDLS
jgi:hypothetical protein